MAQQSFLDKIKFDSNGLVTAVAVDVKDGEIVMLAYVNKEALTKILETKIMHYWSRSRQELWLKGDISGNTQKVCRIRIDCDGDALLFEIEPQGVGAACHDGYRSCFYREFTKENSWEIIPNEKPLFDPKEIYKK